MVQDGGMDQCECEGVEMWMRMLVVMIMIWIVNKIVIGKGGEEFRRVGETAQEFVLCIPLCSVGVWRRRGGGYIG